MIQRDELAGTTLEKRAELAALAVGAAAEAEVKAAYTMALRCPRNEEEARVRIVRLCQNPVFAEKAKYRKPVGSKKNERTGVWEQSYVVGPSIRFAEAALQNWGNCLVQQTTIYNDQDLRIVRVTVRDLERNISYSGEISLEKTVERKSGKGRDVIAERLNSSGEKVCIVRATEDEAQIKQAALVSKMIRTNGLRFIPEHIQEEAMQMATKTLADKMARDPEAERRKLVDAFAVIGVMPKDLEEYLEHSLAQCTTAELLELQEMCTSIRDGHATWSEYLKGEGPAKPETTKGDFSAFQPGDAKTHVAVDQPVGDKKQDAGLFQGTDKAESEWLDFVDWLQDDGERNDAGKEVLKTMRFPKYSAVPPADRPSVMLSINDALKKKGLAK